jgi:mycothiol synthase
MTDWQIRAYKEGDAALIAATWNAAAAADGLDVVIGEQELLSDLERPGFEPFSRVLVVEGPGVDGLPDGMLPGFAWLDIRDDSDASERIYGPRISAHPAARSRGLDRVLARRIIEMARQHESAPSTEHMATVRVRESFSPKQESQHRLYEEMGLRQTRIFWSMECPLDNLLEPRQIEGLRIRGFRRPEDELPTLDALNRSFIDHFDFHPPTEERWTHRINLPTFRPDLSWVAEIDAEPGKLAGFCLCGILEEENRATGRLEGWIETLGTVRGWRGKGLGRALLLYGLKSLKGAGLQIGMLGVDSENPTGATGLYESVGFRVRDTWLQYGCLLSEIRDVDTQNS